MKTFREKLREAAFEDHNGGLNVCLGDAIIIAEEYVQLKVSEAKAAGKIEGEKKGYNKGVKDAIKACLNCKDEDFVLICNQKFISEESFLSLEPTLIKK
jgi:hypothetical protein